MLAMKSNALSTKWITKDKAPAETAVAVCAISVQSEFFTNL